MSWVRGVATTKPLSRTRRDGFVPKLSLEDFAEPNSEISREIRRRGRKKKRS